MKKAIGIIIATISLVYLETYQKLVRIVKRIAPYIEITDHIISTQNNDYLQEREWIHKEYISASCLKLKASMNYKLV